MVYPKPRKKLPEAALRFVLALLVLLALNHAYAKSLTEALLPLIRWEIAQLDDDYRVLVLALSRQGADTVIRLDVGLAHDIVVGARVLPTDPRARANVSTLAGHITQAALLCLAVILALPARGAMEYPLRAPVACAGLALLLLVDVPFVLWAELWDIHSSALDPGRVSLLLWRDFLQGGGRFVLGLGLGVLAVAVAAGQVLATRR